MAETGSAGQISRMSNPETGNRKRWPNLQNVKSSIFWGRDEVDSSVAKNDTAEQQARKKEEMRM